ncbi:MAG: hypothetical protein A3G41_08145 [Elusimicrobia bacterium RIFCSPLOWO2_12_FULL_59_9]|nr:MAG: hypothetical protein A3G41_08145 [Elusimicrobia bacterium RIFCSPLOWO2_12_FULL_59_9]
MAVTKGLVRKKTIDQILLDRKLVSEAAIKTADEKAKATRIPLTQALLEAGAIKKPELLKALTDEWKVKAVDLGQMELDPEIVKIIPEQVARRHNAIPFAKEESVLFVAMATPKDFFISEDIQLRTGLEIQSYYALPEDILNALNKAYGKTEGAQIDKLFDSVKGDSLKEEEGSLELQKEEKTDIAEVDASAPEVERLVNAIILTALSSKASDIHIEPFEDPTGKNSTVVVRYRIDGNLQKGTFAIPWGYRTALAAKIKIMTNSMNITERRIPQSGRIQILAQGKPIEFRVEMVPTVYGESCVMRILDRSSVNVTIDQLCLLPDTQEKFLALLQGIGGKKNFGLILVCGPTGSGKSTTLYSALNYINRADIKILTAENPVEYNIDGIVQVPVNPDLKLGENKKFDFATALRSFLRLDPDVIMVGEIRDEETAHIALEAAMTGHLVFSTIHTNDAPSSLSRLIEMGVPSYMVVGTTKAILAQRLARRLCKDCKKLGDLSAAELATFKEKAVDIPPGTKFFKPVGCDKCKKTGYKGRVGIHELLVLDEKIRNFALKEYAADPLRDFAAKNGMRMIVQDGLEKVIQGLTTVREVIGGTAEAEEVKK